MIFAYKFIQEGRTSRGKTVASSREEAIAKLEKMSITPIEMGEEGKELTPVNQRPIEKQSEKEQIQIVPPPPPNGIVLVEPEVQSEIQRPKTQEKKIIKTHREQSVFYGSYKSIHGLIEDKLKRNGVVICTNMCPDSHGEIQILITIEYDAV